MTSLRTTIVGLILILLGNVLAWTVQTGGGRVEIRDIRWTGAEGNELSALLYVPEGATAASPAPGILAIHGYINSRETQDGFAIEFARRGFVVLALDQPGHGYSAPPAFTRGFGGPDGLEKLRSYDFVDRDNIGLEGHSMGGWAVQLAAASAPDDYRSMVIEGSSTGTSGAPPASADFPRNLAVVFSKYDEFSGMMWRSPIAAEVPAGEKLMAAFGTSEPVEPGRVYGSIADGTARIFHQPAVTHPADHFSPEAIGHAIDWFQRTLVGAEPLPADDQVWFWKEFGNLLGLIGMVGLMLGVGGLLLETSFFAGVKGEPAPSAGATGIGWWLAAAVFAGVPALTLFPFKGWAGAISASALFPQGITNQLMGWALMVGALSLFGFGLWYGLSGRKRGASADSCGLTREGRIAGGTLGRTVLLAVLIVGAGYLSLAISAAVFTTDFRFWVFAVKPMSGLQARMALTYLLPFTLFFAVYGLGLFGQLRREGGAIRETLTVVGLSTAGFAALIAYQYIPLFAGGTLAIPGESLWSIIAFQFLPLMTIVGVVTAWSHRRTGQIYLGALLSGMLVAWIVVASQATHFAAT